MEFVDYNGNDITDLIIQPKENILINSDWLNGIINQKCQTNYSGHFSEEQTPDYTIDMWGLKLEDVSLTVNTNYLTIKNTKTDFNRWFFQKYVYEVNDYLTLYTNVRSLNGSAQCQIAYYDESNQIKTDKFNLKVGDNVYTSKNKATKVDSIYYILGYSSTLELYQAKLELGTQFTGMPIWNEEKELLNCKRFYEEKIYTIPILNSIPSKIEYTVPKNKIPTISFKDNYIAKEGVSGKYDWSILTINNITKKSIDITQNIYGGILWCRFTCIIDAYQYEGA